jgi:hypothetical protein
MIPKVHLENKLFMDRVDFDMVSLKWKDVAQIHVFVLGEAQIGPLGCLKGQPIILSLSYNRPYMHV